MISKKQAQIQKERKKVGLPWYFCFIMKSGSLIIFDQKVKRCQNDTFSASSVKEIH